MKHTPLTGEEITLFKMRLLLIVSVLALVVLLFMVRLWYLQILQGRYFEEVATGNRIRVLAEAGPRGIIYDRNGEILAFNRPSFNIQLVREDTPDLEKTLVNLARLTGIPLAQFHGTVREHRRGFSFKPIELMTDVGRKMADLVDTYQEDLPGISVAVHPKRLYPSAFLTSHILGYVGLVNEEQLPNLNLSQLQSGQVVGQAGVELVQNDSLIGRDGGKQVEVDSVGRVLRVLSQPVNPLPGKDIHLTLDVRLQRFVRTQMAGKKGVVIVSRPRTGEILAMVSRPDYDPNLFVGGIKGKNWQKLLGHEEKPLINKAVQGIYPPGSTFKMVLAAAALDKGVIDMDTKLNCPGYYRVKRDVRWCWKLSGHGELNIVQALEQSCNVFFYQLGLEVGVDEISRYARMFGFGSPNGIELESEKGGLLPSKEWKQRVYKEQWYIGETLPVSIGQGYISVTPLQLSTYVNTVANGGFWVRPTIIREIVTPDGEVEQSLNGRARESRLLPVDMEVFNLIREGMVQSVTKGTGRAARSRHFTVAGKTGTSEVVGRKGWQVKKKEEPEEDMLPHALFVGYAPAENPRISVVVIVEHGRTGGLEAAPIARDIMEYYSRTIEQLEMPKMTPESTPRSAQSANPEFTRALGDAFAGNVGGARAPQAAPERP